jgi:hypothetical protein
MRGNRGLFDAWRAERAVIEQETTVFPAPRYDHVFVQGTAWLAKSERFREIMLNGRRPIDPSDEFSALQPPLTDEQLIELEWISGAMDSGAPRYTCTSCASRRVCPVVFDSYNTDGDCLMEK